MSDDLTDLAERVKKLEGKPTPCEKDGHQYTQCGGRHDGILFCARCGQTVMLPQCATRRIGFDAS